MNAIESLANGVLVETLTGTRLLLQSDPIVLKLDPGGAHRDVTLDGTTTGAGGRTGGGRLIVNAADAAENLVVKNASGSTIVTINQNEAALVMQDSSSGAWTLVCVWTIALS